MLVNESDRLTFRLMSEKDVELLFELDQDPEVMRYIRNGQISSRRQIEEVFIPRMKSYTNPENGWGIWKVSLKNNGDYLGWLIIRPMDYFSDTPQYQNIEIGWRFFRKSWGKGYATEAAENLKQALIENGGIKKISAIAIEENEASTNIMKKLGMKFIKKNIHKDPLGDSEVVFYELVV